MIRRFLAALGRRKPKPGPPLPPAPSPTPLVGVYTATYEGTY